MNYIAQFAQISADLIDESAELDFIERLALGFKALVETNDVTFILYRKSALPVIEYFDEPMKGGSSNLDIFLKGAFLLDPYYLHATQKNQRGFFSLEQISPKGFKQTEYYRTWYSKSGLQDECGYLISLSDDDFVNISIGRTSSLKRFTKQELTLLNDIKPMIEMLAKQYWNKNHLAAGDSDIRERMQHALDNFGVSILTKREQQVVHLILHGHTTKTVSEELNIVVETVKLHRKHAYAKLDINSQSELFYLFIDSLMSVEKYVEGDPLSNYM
ncbi:LuxR C-terminal-related transcriptional regulator [Thalassotalea fonticola]|uniref:LuxR C-terminal-related transcriptional regulator n=1 Tax=Thalassotalea fonticola TaxID=3065649 RepID=A0ABZ0GLF0_9GAMM|nr:LuxR C-terminal-related transcriptional regulator [Colwelliaceae bacterium S1-1]